MWILQFWNLWSAFYVNTPLSCELHRKKMTWISHVFFNVTFLWLSNKVTWKISGEFVSCVTIISWCLLYVFVTWTVRFIMCYSVFYKELCFIFCKELCIYIFLCPCLQSLFRDWGRPFRPSLSSLIFWRKERQVPMWWLYPRQR